MEGKMARIIKRYQNRKLYDTSAKRYLTLEEVAGFVETGEEVRIIDKATGDDITSVVLSKAISERIADSAGKEKVWPPALLAEMIQKRSDAVVDYLKQGFAAGAKTVKDVEEQLQQRWKRATGKDEAVGASATEELKMILHRMVEESMRFLIAKMNLPTRSEINALNERLDEIERALKIQKRSKAQTRAKRSRASQKALD
jgi:polyhydroxyalkanoate synthesis repressor PhaR